MKKKKLTKLLPAALALMLMSTAAYAAPSDEATSTLQITVPEFINITKDGSSTETTSATFDDNYSTITLSPSLNAIFNVINNQPGNRYHCDCRRTGGRKSLHDRLFSSPGKQRQGPGRF